MKYFKIVIAVTFLLILQSCAKDCNEITNAACSDVVPTGTTCAAAFQSWFYDKDKNRCEEIAYSGCSDRGFETKEECKECKCK